MAKVNVKLVNVVAGSAGKFYGIDFTAIGKGVLAKDKKSFKGITLVAEGVDEDDRRDGKGRETGTSRSGGGGGRRRRHGGAETVLDFKLSNTPENFFGGQIVDFLSNWEKVTSDPWVLKNAAGIEIPLLKKPMYSCTKTVCFTRF